MQKFFSTSIIKNLIEDIYLLYINISNAFYNFFYFIVEVFKFYPNTQLRKADIEIFRLYAIKDQFTVSAEEGKEVFSLDKEELTYGEAIWSSIDKIMRIINPEPGKVFYDLGCGVGRVCFFANIKYGLKSYGIDLLPTFINNADKIVKKLNLKNISFLRNNWLEIDFSDADIIYVAGTCLSDETLDSLTEKIVKLKSGTYVISVSNLLNSDKLLLIKEMYLPFSWGKAEVYLMLVK